MRNDRRRAGIRNGIHQIDGREEEDGREVRHGTEGHRATGTNARGGGEGGRGGKLPRLQARIERAHESYDRCPEIKGSPTERNKVSQSRRRPACSNVIGYGSDVGALFVAHRPDARFFFTRPLCPPPCFRGRGEEGEGERVRVSGYQAIGERE